MLGSLVDKRRASEPSKNEPDDHWGRGQLLGAVISDNPPSSFASAVGFDSGAI